MTFPKTVALEILPEWYFYMLTIASFSASQLRQRLAFSPKDTKFIATATPDSHRKPRGTPKD